MLHHNLTLLFTKQEIAETVTNIARQINKDYSHIPTLLVCCLKGGVVFFSDLMRQLDVPIVGIEFIQMSSYGACTKPSHLPEIQSNLSQISVEGQNLLIIDDIIDTGITMSALIEALTKLNPLKIEIFTLLDKPSRREIQIDPKYIGFTIPDQFVIGYGMDYSQSYRNLPDIYFIQEPKQEEI